MVTPSLYERIGGEAGISRMIDAFYGRVLADPSLAPFFAHAPVEKLQAMQKEFFSEALGGPLFYSGRSLRDVHAGRGISKEHLRLFLGHMLETLAALPLEAEDVRAIYARVALEADEIADGSTSAG